jgi:hypothetical protein
MAPPACGAARKATRLRDGLVVVLAIGAVCGGLAALQAPAVVPVAVMVPLAVVLAFRLLTAVTGATSR